MKIFNYNYNHSMLVVQVWKTGKKHQTIRSLFQSQSLQIDYGVNQESNSHTTKNRAVCKCKSAY